MIKALIFKLTLFVAALGVAPANAVATSATTSVAASIVIIDDAKSTVTLKRPARRIVALAPFLTELVFAADAAKHLVGVSAYSDYPVAAKALPVVADYQGVAMESLLAVKPDLVLAWQSGNRPQDIARILSLGIPVVQFELKSLTDIPRAITVIAQLTGVSAQPETVQDFNLRLAALINAQRTTNAHSAPPRKIRYFLPIERMPLMTLSGAHIVSKALAVCGGENIFANATALAPVVDKEGIVAGKPEIIFVSATQAGREAIRAPLGDGLAKLPVAAIENNHIFGLNPDWLMRPTPRMLGAVESACAAMNMVRSAPN